MNKKEIIEKISSMSLVELVELIDSIEKKFGICKQDYKLDNNVKNNKKNNILKNEFSITLNKIGNNKIAVIKLVRSILNLGLKQSKDLVESAPVLIKDKVNKKDIDILKKSFEDIGSEVLVK